MIYLGGSIEKNIINQFSNDSRIEYLFLHIITNFTGWDADVYFEDICRSFHTKTIVVTGAITQQLQRNFINVKILKTDNDIYKFVERKG